MLYRQENLLECISCIYWPLPPPHTIIHLYLICTSVSLVLHSLTSIPLMKEDLLADNMSWMRKGGKKMPSAFWVEEGYGVVAHFKILIITASPTLVKPSPLLSGAFFGVACLCRPGRLYAVNKFSRRWWLTFTWSMIWNSNMNITARITCSMRRPSHQVPTSTCSKQNGGKAVLRQPLFFYHSLYKEVSTQKTQNTTKVLNYT